MDHEKKAALLSEIEKAKKQALENIDKNKKLWEGSPLSESYQNGFKEGIKVTCLFVSDLIQEM